MSTCSKNPTLTEPAFLGADQKKRWNDWSFLLACAPPPEKMIKISVFRDQSRFILQNQAQFTLLDVRAKLERLPTPDIVKKSLAVLKGTIFRVISVSVFGSKKKPLLTHLISTTKYFSPVQRLQNYLTKPCKKF